MPLLNGSPIPGPPVVSPARRHFPICSRPETSLANQRRVVKFAGSAYTTWCHSCVPELGKRLSDMSTTHNIRPSEFLDEPKPAPALNIPSGRSIKVSVIDCKARISGPVAYFIEPAIDGHTTLVGPAFSFLVEHTSGRKVLFDLSVRKDPENFAPWVRGLLESPGWNINTTKDVADTLREGGLDVAGGDIEAIIWSHWHFDHAGNPSTFPDSTDLVVGPGMVDALLPAYPKNPESPLLESDFAGRELRTIDFSAKPFKIGPFPAFDYFDDGSFYLLDAPGHAIGHICGLARTTSKQDGDEADTFVFMGADTAHHGGEFRPTMYLPLPANITPTPVPRIHPNACPGHIFQQLHEERSANKPFYKIKEERPHDANDAHDTLYGMQDFDATDDVFVVIAHDRSLLSDAVGLPLFPKATLNNWKRDGLAEKGRWQFLEDFETAVNGEKNGALL